MTMKQLLDRNLNKFISRKLMVWLSATGFLCTGYITNEQWVALALAYVGVQGFADIAVKWKAAGREDIS
tara:strand:+ start:681 stop:887 length:207 start_codon:yes stop_codon:yes gene_type:complete